MMPQSPQLPLGSTLPAPFLASLGGTSRSILPLEELKDSSVKMIFVGSFDSRPCACEQRFSL
jgi:hypothetical protein